MTEAGGVGKTKITSEDVHGCHVHVTTCFLYSNTEVFVPLPAGIAEGWMIWCDVARDSTCGNKTWQKSWDRAEMAQAGQNYHHFLKRAENQNDQNLMVVWWYRFTINSPCRTHFRFFCPLLRVTFAKIFRQVFTDDSLTYSSFTQISRPVLFWEPETNTLRGFGCAMKTVLAITIMLHSVLLYKYVKINAK